MSRSSTKAYSLCIADLLEALALFREQERRHEEQLRQANRGEQMQFWLERVERGSEAALLSSVCLPRRS